MRILVIQHDADKGLGLFVRPLAEASLELDVRFAGHGELELDGHAAVIALPGLADPDEDTEAVTSTRAVLRDALARDLPVLGICLGAELLAEAAGARTRRCEPEFGFHPLTLAPPARDDALLADLPSDLVAFQAHAFAVEPSTDTVVLGSSPAAPQAFRIGRRAWGIQFHPEPTLEMLDGWTRSLDGVMRAAGADPGETRRLGRRYVPEWRERVDAMGRRFAAACAVAAP
jgi:GMP synthase-like glutamine amidotransferase